MSILADSVKIADRDPTETVVLYGIPPQAYLRLVEALVGVRTRHTYQHGALEIRRVLYGITPEQYQAVLEALGDLSFRHTYLHGQLEFMSPLHEHDRTKTLIGSMIEAICWRLKIPIYAVGSMTIGAKEVTSSLQPDEAYYFQHAAEMEARRRYEIGRDAPPDLAIEIDVTRNSLSRMETYALIGVPEIWRHSGSKLTFYELTRGKKYREIAYSKALPFLAPSDFEQFLSRAEKEGARHHEILDAFFAHARRLHRKHHSS